MQKLFVGVMLIASMSNVGCSSCDKKTSQQKANACLSDPACVNQVRAAAGNGMPPNGIALNVDGANKNPALYGGQLANTQAPAVLPFPTGAVKTASTADVAAHQKQVAAKLQAALQDDEIVNRVVPKANPNDVAAAAGLMTQEQQLNGQADTGAGGVR
jgi:hypothetical protein